MNILPRHASIVLGAALALGLAVATVPAQQLTGSAPSKSDKSAKSEPAAKIGESAPDFTLKDADGKKYKLSDYRGKIVVLQWINPKCPVCKGCMSDGTVDGMLSRVKQIDDEVVFLPINSTHSMEPARTADYLKQYEIDAPGLIDRDGTVGHLYGARTTPHLFVIDKEGVLRYDGAIDSKRSDPGDETVNYVVNAVRQIANGETVTPDKTRPYGCSVKYKKA